jgi:membrane protein required for colicin V production
MNNFIDFLQNNILAFDVIIFLIIFYSMAECTSRGFMLSILSFSKWLIALIITLILTPRLNPFVQDYVESPFIADIGLGIFIYIFSLFVIINIAKTISKTITYTGLGAADKSFGLLFGIFKGYIISICIFSLFNWFYPHQNWSIETENAYSFDIIYRGHIFLIEELPNSKDFYEDTEEKIEKI